MGLTAAAFAGCVTIGPVGRSSCSPVDNPQPYRGLNSDPPGLSPIWPVLATLGSSFTSSLRRYFYLQSWLLGSQDTESRASLGQEKEEMGRSQRRKFPGRPHKQAQQKSFEGGGGGGGAC